MKPSLFRGQLYAGLSSTMPSIPTSFLFALPERVLEQSEVNSLTQAFGSGFRFEQDGLSVPSGSDLFRQITETSAYYTNKDELALIDQFRRSPVISQGDTHIITELGPGTGDKSKLFMSKFGDSSFSYQAMDVSARFLEETAQKVQTIGHCTGIKLVEADFLDREALQRQGIEKADTVLMLGNTFGNFAPAQARELVSLITDTLLADEGTVILGLDSNHEENTLLAAYDDPEERTSTFALNALLSMKYDLGMKLDFSAYDYQARFVKEQEMMQMGLLVTKDTAIDGIALPKDSFVEVGRSYKYSRQSLVTMLGENGCTLTEVQVSPHGMALYQFNKVAEPVYV